MSRKKLLGFFPAIFMLVMGLTANIASAQDEMLRIGCGATVELCDWLAFESAQISGVEVAVTKAEPSVLIDGLKADYMARRSRFDLLWGLPSIYLHRAIQDDLLRHLNITQIDRQFRWSRQLWDDSEGYIIGVYAGTLVLVTNPVTITDSFSPPTCWADLADITMQGNIVMDKRLDVSFSALMSQIFTKMFGPVRARQMIEQIRRNAGNEGLETDSALMDVVLGFKSTTVGLAHDAMPYYSFFSPLITAPPCEGTGAVIFGAAIPYYSNNPESASYFVDFSLSTGFQNEVSNHVSGAMFSNPDSPPSEIYLDRRLLNIINIDPLAEDLLMSK